MEEKIIIEKEDYIGSIVKDDEESLLIVFRGNHFGSKPMSEELRKKLKEDIKDWGKWREYKQLKKELTSSDTR